MKSIVESINSNLIAESWRDEENADSIAWDITDQAGSKCSNVLDTYQSELVSWLMSYQSSLVKKGNNADYDWFTLIQKFAQCVVKFKGEVPDKKNKNDIIFTIKDWKDFEKFAKGEDIE